MAHPTSDLFRRPTCLEALKDSLEQVREADQLTFATSSFRCLLLQLMLCRDLLHGLVATQRFQRHLGFKLLCKVTAFRHSRIPSKVWETP